MVVYGIEFSTEDENKREIEVQPSLEIALQRLTALYNLLYHDVKDGIIYPDYATLALGRLVWKSEDSEEWF